MTSTTMEFTSVCSLSKQPLILKHLSYDAFNYFLSHFQFFPISFQISQSSSNPIPNLEKKLEIGRIPEKSLENFGNGVFQ